MLHLSAKDYDLNTIFCFESLKEILIELAKSQIKMENELKNIREGNKERDNTILELKSIINNYNINEENKNTKTDNNKGQDNDKNENQKIIENPLDSNQVIKKEKISEKDKNNAQMDNNENGNNLENKNNEVNKEKEKEKGNISNNKGMKDKSEDDDNAKVSSFLIIQMNKQIKENKSKIDSLEENIKNHDKNIKDGENQLKNLSLESQNELKSLNDKVNSLLKINNQLEQKVESLESNIHGLDIMNMFHDDGSGTVDATRVMVKSLQEKVFKKFELVEARYKRDGEENMKTKSLVENILPKIEKINKDLESINELNQQKNEESEKFKNINNELTDEIKNLAINELDKKLEKLKEEIDMDMSNKIKEIEDKLSIMSTGEKDSIKLLDKKISDLRKKLNNIENTIKIHLKAEEIENIKNELKDIKSALESKLSKADLKELYNNNLQCLDEINDIKDKLDTNDEEITKLREDFRSAIQRMENFQGNLLLHKSSPAPPENKTLLDLSKYIDEKKTKESMNPIFKEIDNLLKELTSLKNKINEIENDYKSYVGKKIDKLEEENNNKISDFKTFVQNKYLGKYEFNRIIKPIESQIKIMNNISRNHDADSWLLAKQNISCFNCASCEANIKNDSYSTADYLAWKKYPKGEKIHRMGQGFSHMLEMMRSDIAKDIERNELINEKNNNTINEYNYYTNTLPNKDERPSSTKLRLNKNEMTQQEYFMGGRRKVGRMKLPKMMQSKIRLKKDNYTNIVNQISDDDVSIENMDGAPRILKIIKKNKNNVKPSSSETFKSIQEERVRIEKDNDF